MLSHPTHAMRPSEHVLSQRVIEFLIEHQDHFLVGMQLVSVRCSSLSKKPRRKRRDKPAPLQKADPSLMIPSDSDDDVPEGGYYVVPRDPLPRLPPPVSQPPPPPERSPAKLADIMQPSDSDDDAPPGGYEVRVSAQSQLRAQRAASSTGAGVSRRKTMPSRRVEALASRFRSSREV